jgi:hypothetical protein
LGQTSALVRKIESSPIVYAGFNKMMVRRAFAEHPAPTFSQLVASALPI